ncbi:hypothetical protein [Haladaptatus sp. W1]|uniref:hypothetical protein n=1 Tax=Haladaptatus sp. W1 TaxID=1897478 RepID=UPI0020C7AF8C|nr:hypothetical protein [Haladaptatus sp. W1]
MTETRDGEDETRIAHLSGWFRQRPTSMEYWELLVTNERLVWCFVGESFKSMLLRADTGERGREELADATADRALSFSDRNFAVPLDSVQLIRLREGTLFRRAKLTVSWTDGDADEFELSATKSRDPQVADVEALENDSRLSHVDIAVESAGLF